MNSVLTYTLRMRRTRATKKIRASGIAALLAAASPDAFAADLLRAPAAVPIQKPVAPVVPVWSWTGFYIGFNVGGSVGVDSNSSALTTCAECGPGFLSADVKRALPGGIAGGQIGYNWQLGPSWVFGAEADWQWSGERNTLNVAGQDFNGNLFTYADEERISSIGTARARFGWIQDSFLWYVTGGGAWADVKNDYLLTTTSGFFPPLIGANFSSMKSGWTIGGGVETHLGGNWTAKLEYLFVDLGSVSHTFAASTSSVFDSTHSVQDHVIRIGMNYKFL